MTGHCALCARTSYLSTVGETKETTMQMEFCDGCGRATTNCSCDPLPNLTISFDVFVDRAWMEKDELTTINGMPQLPFAVGSICGEAGEAWEKVKKMYRDDLGQLTDERRLAILNELGDVVFYVAKAAHLLKAGLSQVMDLVKEKNERRIREGTQHGSGDHR